MKRYFLAAIALLLAISANAQLFDFSSNNNRFEFGFDFGTAATHSNHPSRFANGINAVICGVYVGFLEASPQHRYDNHVNANQYNDDEAYLITAGYQIPVLPWLRIMPVVGYAQTNEGITDASTVNISSGEYSSTMYHDYDVTPGSRVHYFNYGGGISVQPVKWLSLNAVYTAHGIYGGIGFDLVGIIGRK
ncbi:MAG: hypothetical protein J6X89_01690 [Bacteroidales bacterium]|nr:hypothetical protein [Bacteroidales bacterium]